MAYSGGIDWVTTQATLHSWVVECTGVAADHIVWGQQQAPRPTQAGIIMRLMMLEDHNRPWVDQETNPLVLATITITSVDDTANTFTKVAHGLLTGDGPIQLTGTDLPLNITAETDYWVIKVDDDTFKLATSFVDAMSTVPVPVDLGDAGSGVMTLDSNGSTLRAGEEITFLQRSLQKAVLTLECYTNNGVGLDMASSILWRIAAKRLLPTPFAMLTDANISVIEVGRVRALAGTQGQYLFEPRAMVDIQLYLVSEDSENTTIIERTELTNEETGHEFAVEAYSEEDPDDLVFPFGG